jgi:hypothetical protein
MVNAAYNAKRMISSPKTEAGVVASRMLTPVASKTTGVLLLSPVGFKHGRGVETAVTRPVVGLAAGTLL